MASTSTPITVRYLAVQWICYPPKSGQSDEVAFETVLGLGGVAVKVGAGETLAPYRLADPAALHAWMDTVLARFAAGREQEVCS